jgi:hypothetical protein
MTDHPAPNDAEEPRRKWPPTPEDVRRGEIASQIWRERSAQEAQDDFFETIQSERLAGKISPAREGYLLGLYAEQAQANCEASAAFWAKQAATSREATESARRKETKSPHQGSSPRDLIL